MLGDSVTPANKDGAKDGAAAAADARYTLSSYVMTEQERTRQEQDRARKDSVDPVAVASMFGKSLVYSAVQNPLDGATQLMNQIARPVTGGHDVVPQIQVISQPDAPANPAEWTAKLAGGGIGTVLPFYYGGKLAVKAVEPLAGVKVFGPAIEATQILKENSVGQLAFKGAVYEGLLHPVNEGSGLSMVRDRFVNAASGAGSFMLMGAANKYMRESSFGKSLVESRLRPLGVASDFAIDGVSGAVAGLSDTVIHSAATGSVPTWENLAQSAGEYGVMGLFLKGARLPFEKAANEPPVIEPQGEALKSKPEHAEPLRLRPTLPFDKIESLRQRMSDGTLADLIGASQDGKWKLYYKEDAPPAPAEGQPAIRVPFDNKFGERFQMVEHRGQTFAIDRHGATFAMQHLEGGIVELVPTNKVILDRIGEVQMPWPPMQNDEQYRTRTVLRLSDLWSHWKTAEAH